MQGCMLWRRQPLDALSGSHPFTVFPTSGVYGDPTAAAAADIAAQITILTLPATRALFL